MSIDGHISPNATYVLVPVLLIAGLYRSWRWGYGIPRTEWKDPSRMFPPETLNPEKHYTKEGQERYYRQFRSVLGLGLFAIVAWLIADYLT